MDAEERKEIGYAPDTAAAAEIFMKSQKGARRLCMPAGRRRLLLSVQWSPWTLDPSVVDKPAQLCVFRKCDLCEVGELLQRRDLLGHGQLRQ